MKNFRQTSFIFLSVLASMLIFAQSGKAEKESPCYQDADEKMRLIEKAEANEYNVRSIYISGNTYTRYRTFRERWDENFSEGSIFTLESLMKSIEGTNKLKTIEPIKLGNVRVRLEENDSRGWNAIDFTICVEQK